MSKKSRRTGGAAVLETSAAATPDGTDVPVVGMREPCPCGSGKRYKACHGRQARLAATELVRRPFEGLPGECDWVALREIVPAATAAVRTTGEHGAADVTVVTLLPMAWPAMRRADGSVHVGLQTQGAPGDPSRTMAAALLAALAAEPGTPVLEGDLPGPGPRLQDVLDTSDQEAGLDVHVHTGFDFWLDGVEEVGTEVRASMERANASVVPTVRLESVEAAYWCRMGERRHLRWVLPQPEDQLLDGIARLHSAGASALGPGTRYVGAFRTLGLLVPVWDLAADTEPEELEEPVVAFAARLEEAMASTAPLSADERRARAGVVGRQLTLR